MVENVIVEAEERADTGKNACRRIRREGKLPAVVYGGGQAPHIVAVSPRRISEVLRLEAGRNTIFHLALAGEDRSRAVMIKDLHRDPVSEKLLHVDFIRVDLDKIVTVRVPIRLVGSAEGVKAGGILEFILRHVEVECLPGDIPEHLDVDVTPLQINQHVIVSSLPVSDKVKVLDPPDNIVAAVLPPRAEEVPAAVAEEGAPEAAAEPEVIKKGKEAAASDEPATSSKDKAAKDREK